LQEGIFLNNKLNGYGRIIYFGEKTKYYEGHFENHLKHGYGIKVYTDGKYEIGTWDNDIFISSSL